MRSRLYLRLLVVALLVLFLPIAGVWSLASFEKELLASEERAMATQARTFAAWLGARLDPPLHADASPCVRVAIIRASVNVARPERESVTAASWASAGEG